MADIILPAIPELHRAIVMVIEIGVAATVGLMVAAAWLWR
jgi:UPF0716 family protein affecting phage T7 exclusion